MKLPELKALAEQFEAAADNPDALRELADETSKTHRGDQDVIDLCGRMKGSADSAPAIRAIVAEVKARTR